MRQISELPSLSDFGSIDLDLEGTCDRIFALQESSLLRLDAGVAVVRYDDLRTLAAHPLAGNTPAPKLLSWTVQWPDGALRPADEEIGTGLTKLLENHIFGVNPPIHQPLRRMLIKQISPKVVAAMGTQLNEMAGGLVNELAGENTIDFAQKIATEMLSRVAGLMFDLTPDERKQLVPGYKAVGDFFRLDSGVDQLIAADSGARSIMAVMRQAAQRNLAASGTNAFKFIQEELEQLHYDGSDPDVGTPPADAAAMLAANLLDLFHTGATLAPCVLYRLLLAPTNLSAVRSNPALVSAAVREGARLSTPVRQVPRYALGDIVYNDVSIPKGTTIHMFWEAGNRDPAAFEQPHAFRLDRSAHVGVTFGGGTHVCPGRHIGVAVTEAIIRAVVREGIEVELTDNSDHWDNMSTSRMVKRLPVRIGETA